MTPSQQLESGIVFLERAMPSDAGWAVNLSGLRQLTPVTMRALGRFWREQESPQNVLGAATARLLSGFRASCAPWGVLVQSERGILQFHWLMPGGAAGALTWASTADAAFPGAGFVVKAESSGIMGSMQRHRHAAAFVARHPRKVERNAHFSPDLARMAAAMRGGDWSYVMVAQPISAAMLAGEVEGIRCTEQEVRRTWMRRGTSEENNHPRARHYVELLEAEHERHLEGSASGMWDVQACLLADNPQILAAGAMVLQGQLTTAALPLASWSAVTCGLNGTEPTALSRLTSRETAALVPLPTEDCAGTPVRQRVAFARHGATAAGNAVSVGCVMADGQRTADWFQVPVNDFARHGLICGTPGSGKSHTARFILRQLREEHGLPFLVVDPAKSDYEQLLASPLGRDLRIFAPGLPGTAPFPFNPLAVPEGVPVHLHADGVKSLLLASFGWVTPMPVALALAVQQIYELKGWDFHTGTHPEGHGAENQPTLSNLIELVPAVVNECGWDAEVSANVSAGITARLRALIQGTRGRVLDVAASVPLSWLLEKPTVIELGWFGNNEDRAFLMGALVLALANHRRAHGPSTALRHVLLIEEAHRLLSVPPATISGGEVANPKQQAVEEFCQLLAEIRAYGQGLLIVEQMPTRLPADVLANTSLKICHHLVSDADRRAIGGSTNLRDDQRQFLARLDVGEAVALRAGCHEAFQIAVPDHAKRLGYGSARITKEQIKAHMLAHPLPL